MHGYPTEFWWAFGLGSLVLLLLSLSIIVIIVNVQRRSVADQQRRLAELSASEEKYRSIFQNSLFGLVRLSMENNSVIEANGAALMLFESASAEELTRNLPVAMGTDFTEIIGQLREKGIVENRECRFTRVGKPDGWCIFSARVDPKQPIAECVLLDVYEKKSIEEQLLRAQRLESIGVLAGGIAHDLNNVLTPIFGSVEFLIKQKDRLDGRRFLEIIRSSAKRAADLIAQLLVFARGMEGKREPIQPVTVAREVLLFIKETFPKDIDIRFEGGSTVWQIVADPTQLHQILMNLCVNARDAMMGGGTLSVKMENVVLDRDIIGVNAVAKPGPYVRIAVADTGAGISREILDKIFEPFFTTKELGKGTGLGLSTTLGIVKSHNGVIVVESSAARGTEFSIYFRHHEELASHAEQLKTSRRAAAAGQCVLLVDDEPNVLDTFRSVLESSGYRVLVAEDGDVALSVFDAHHQEIHGVITDLMMPNRGGVDTIRELRKRKPGLPIIATTGLSFPDELRQQGFAKPNALLRKPFHADELLDLLVEHIQ